MQTQRLVGDELFTVDAFVSRDEAKDILRRAESSGFQPSPPSGGGHGRTGRETSRSSKYVIIVDQDLADRLFTRVLPMLPGDLRCIASSVYFSSAGGSEWHPCGLLERFRVYKYDKNDSYPLHQDGGFRRTVVDRGGNRFLQQTFHTLLIYLNDGFDGGHTDFFLDKSHCRFLSERETRPPPTHSIVPAVGSAVCSLHTIFHQGNAVHSGTKYVVRTDIIYQRPLALHPKVAKFAGEQSSHPNITEWEKIFEPSCKLYHD